jgi:hypothetical protein
MPSDFTLEEIARALIRIEAHINQLVRRDVFDLEMRETKERVEKIEAWLTWGTRIVVGAAITAVLSYAWVSK